MLNDSDIAKLCYGRIVSVGGVIDSIGNAPVGPHWAIVLDSKEDIIEHDNVTVVMISTKVYDQRFLIPVPARTGLIGNIVCSWQPRGPVDMAAILEIHPETLTDSEMLAVEKMIVKHRKSTQN